MRIAKACALCVVVVAAFGWQATAEAQTSPPPARPLITQPIDDTNLVVLPGNTRPEAAVAANDRGIIPDETPLPHMMLQLRRPAEREQALETLIDQLHDPKSPNFHHWLSAVDFGAQFGPASSDIQAVTRWLEQHGFTINTVFPSGMTIDYSGTAGQVRAAFHTEIHNLVVNGVAHLANMSDPAIPAALAPAVIGIVSLHDFRPRPGSVHAPMTTTGGNYYVTPADLATIYNFKPLFAGGTSGQGQAIYLIEPTDLYSAADWTTFRAGFGLSGYAGGSLTTVHPGNCTDPGLVAADEAEAILDAEYASAAAPSAAIVMATCKSTTTFGGLIAIQNLVNGTNPPAIISYSYIESEPFNGASSNAAYKNIYQQGVAEGISIFVCAGDEDAGASNYGGHPVTDGITVNGFASTPYNVAVGGTDFSDTYFNVNSTYWSSTNTSSDGSALSYIPEIPWNETCGSQLWAAFEGFSTTYGANGFCNSTYAATHTHPHLDWGGSGGPSGCATGAASVSGVVSGTCAGYAKPSWQSGFLGNPADGVRDLPDVSLFASFGPWKHGYVICFSDTANGGVTCDGTATGWDYDWGGTSFASPIWAGIQALINQAAGGRQGLPNYRYYQLAAEEYGTSGSSACNSSNGNAVASTCVFYDVTLGDNDAACQANNGIYYNCYIPSGTYGVVSTSNSAYAPAFVTTVGWDFATGIGTVNVTNLVRAWASGVRLADTHDFNGDSKSDLRWRDNGNDIAVWLMNGGQPSQAAVLCNVGASWTVIGQRDFNGDGKADLLWRDSSGNLAIWLMNGLAVSSAAIVANVTGSWAVYGTGDLNGDGKGDLLWRDGSGNIAIWFMNGAQIASTALLGNVPMSWTIVGDDNKGNIFWRDSSGDIAIWQMSGTQIMASVGLGNAPSNWVIAGLGDFDGNGSTDILWRDNNSQTVEIWFMNGTQVISAASLGVTSSAWNIAQTGDYNGDGNSDILWMDNSGNVAIWFMTGAAFSSSLSGNVGTSWSVQSANTE